MEILKNCADKFPKKTGNYENCTDKSIKNRKFQKIDLTKFPKT